MALSTSINASLALGGIRSFTNATYIHNPHLKKVISVRGVIGHNKPPEPVVDDNALLSALDNSILISAITGETLTSSLGT